MSDEQITPDEGTTALGGGAGADGPSRRRLLKAGLIKIAREILNPEQAVRKLQKRFSRSKWNSLKRP